MKNPKPSPIGVAVGTSLVPQRDAPSCAARFERFVRSAGAVALTFEPTHCVIACLIAFDAVTSVQELDAILRHLPSARKVDESVFVGWTADGKQCRKVLSARTTIALSKLPADVDLGSALKTFLPALAKIYPCAQGWLMKEVWANVFRDAQAWLYNILPAYQFSVLYGHWNCTLLPDPVLTRNCELSRALYPSDDHGATDEAEAVAVDAAFEKVDKAGSQPSYLNELKGLFTSPTGGDTVRVSDQRWRNDLKEKLQSTAKLIGASGSYVDSILLWWVCYLVTVGSVRLANPAVTTIAKYFGDLAEPIADAIQNADSRPDVSKESFWDAVFSELHPSTSDSSSRAALASFHLFCVESFGIEILPGVVFDKSAAASHVSANVVWSAEYGRALDLCESLDSDRRVGAATKVLLSIAGSVPIRIGEIRALHIEDVSISDGVLQIHFSPRANEHSGKSRSASRYLRTSDPSAMSAIEAWIARRKAEGAENSHYLFGDPHNHKKLYKFGRCVSLVNRLLKAVTGDVTVRFHTLRHAWVNEAILQANENYTGTRGISALQEIASMAGHASEETTLACYFHRMEWAVRYSIDRYVNELPAISSEVAGWLGTTSVAVRKGKQRSKKPDVFYVRLLQERAAVAFRPVAAPVESEVKGNSAKTSGLEFATVSHVFRDLVAGHDDATICLRTGIEVTELGQLKSIATDCLNLLGEDTKDARIRNSVWGTDEELSPELPSPLVERLREYSDFKWNTHLAALEGSLTSMNRPSVDVRKAIQVWFRTKSESALDLTDPVRSKPLLMLLQVSGVTASNLLIRLGCDNPEDRHGVATLMNEMSAVNVLSTCQSIFSGAPRVEIVKARTGIPSAYALLTNCRSSLHARVPPASLRMSGFHTLMLLAAVWSGYHSINS